MTARGKVRRSSAPRNWLKEWDTECAAARTPSERQSYSAFYFVRSGRYEYLTIPLPTFTEEVSRWKAQLAKHEEVVKDLGADQRDQLAALMFDTMLLLEAYRGPASTSRRTGLKQQGTRMRRVAEEAKRRRKMLLSKLNGARKALTNLDHYAQTLDAMHGGSHFSDLARKCLKILAAISGDTSTDHEEKLRVDYPAVKDPTNTCMVQLYWFFHSQSGCGIAANQAEVRVASIRNAFWTELGIRPIKALLAYDGAESAGCSAVAEAVRRFR